jgi:hypothetical protein
MSDEFHRPTYTSADANNAPTNSEGLYNPTQVRLYGIPGEQGDMLVVQSTGVSVYDTRLKVEVDLKQPGHVDPEEWGHYLDKQISLAQEFLDVFRSSRDMSAVDKFRHALSLPPGLYKEYAATFGARTFGPITLYASPPEQGKMVSCGVMFGYAYEGHTYDFPKPKVMLVPVHPLTKIPKDDSGYDLKEPEGYAVWIVDKLDECVEVEIDQGFVDQLVLEANLPGRRSPTQYKAMMTLAHRGGRLTD